MSTSGSRGFVTELLKDIIYPEVCPICGDIITVDRRTAYHKARDTRGLVTNNKRILSAYYGGLVCDSCLANLDFIAQPYCSKCGKPLNGDAMSYGVGAEAISVNSAASSDIAANSFAVNSHVENSAINSKLVKSSLTAGGSVINGIVADDAIVHFDTLYYHAEDTFQMPGGTAYSASLRSTAVPTGTCSGAASPALLCTDCRTHARSFIQCRALLSYDERMRDIMADIKYNGKREYLKLFGLLAADKLGAWIAGNNINCLIPVPIHASRLLKRGYNQSELLCEYISELTHIPVRRDIIIREKKTAAQKELNVDERLLNLQNAFKPAGKLPQGSRALIVDDIYTTGSTMEACTECLRAAGAEAVYGLAVCIGEDKEAKDTTEGTNHGIQKRH